MSRESLLVVTVLAALILTAALSAADCTDRVITLRGVLDRFEGTTGVVLLGEDEATLDVPRRYLPYPAREGEVIEISINLCGDRTRSLMQLARRRLSDLKRTAHNGPWRRADRPARSEQKDSHNPRSYQ